ncbi:division/cell wall cluster transcriptional repressor MraZ [Sneathiella aquimaris]|uniref:division/cell wall cluster transcriptional repressor MraZ n=1 Tax=Sneathiella aquimaris TaxID=2599305 RepID=UPI00146F791D|nr:cell division/cell wall cluster transcriptional repressor MraZ [Sneathiella aquimaris]
MALFLSKYLNKVDKKGRVSVPARFRATLAEKGYTTVILFPTIGGDAINACGMDVMEGLLESLGRLDLYSEEQDSDADVLMAESVELPIDGDGRIVIPLEMLRAVGIQDACVFAGRGDSFRIWEPKAYEANIAAAKERARAKRARKSARMAEGAND